MIDAYCTAAEADGYLAGYADWLVLTTAQKDDHLSWGRVFIDVEYLCPYDETDATDELKQANAYLGYSNFKGYLFEDSESLNSESVTAGSVTTSKVFRGGYKKTYPENKRAALLLNGDCTDVNPNGSVSLTRV